MGRQKKGKGVSAENAKVGSVKNIEISYVHYFLQSYLN